MHSYRHCGPDGKRADTRRAKIEREAYAVLRWFVVTTRDDWLPTIEERRAHHSNDSLGRCVAHVTEPSPGTIEHAVVGRGRRRHFVGLIWWGG